MTGPQPGGCYGTPRSVVVKTPIETALVGSGRLCTGFPSGQFSA